MGGSGGRSSFRTKRRRNTTVDSTRRTARYKDGVMRLVLPKKDESKPRQVSVEREKE